MNRYETVRHQLLQTSHTWLVTGAAGFIGSNLVEELLALGQHVIGLDNFATGHRRNIDDVYERSGANAPKFRFEKGDVRDLDTCRRVCDGVTYVLHTAALGSVSRSIENPIATNATNLDGFLNVLVAARDANVSRLIYSTSSSVYGDHPGLPKVEHRIGRPLSPYAVTKLANELYADVFQRTYGLEGIGLRYFNVFGRRQDPDGAYAAVIPRWIEHLLTNRSCEIYGDGETSRDFCYIANVVQANILAALAPGDATGHIYNVACGDRTTLSDLFAMLRDGLARHESDVAGAEPVYRDVRPGDVRHSQADIGRARTALGYAPTHSVADGLAEALEWYVRDLRQRSALQA